MDDKEGIKDFYKKKCEVPDAASGNIVTSCSRRPKDVPVHVKQALELIHEDVMSRSYGCSTAYPEALQGAKILDLGSGTGRDCFVLSNLVGQDGSVVGMDMTDEMLDFAKSKILYHQEKYGYASPNVSFIKGEMEKMCDAGLEENSFDIIVSNCVICLSKDKKAVLKEAARALKPCGEMYFSDMYRQNLLPSDVLDDEILWCEGLTGSLTYQELNTIAMDAGFTTPRMVKARALPVLDKNVKDRLGNAEFAAVTYRLFKQPTTCLGPSTLRYKGGIAGSDDVFEFDHKFRFQKNQDVDVDGETATIIIQSRFGKYFEQTGTPDKEGCIKTCEMVDPFSLI